MEKAKIVILYKEGYSQRQIVRHLKISRNGVKYSFQSELESNANDERICTLPAKVTAAVEVKHLMFMNKRNKRKTSLTTEINYSPQSPEFFSPFKTGVGESPSRNRCYGR